MDTRTPPPDDSIFGDEKPDIQVPVSGVQEPLKASHNSPHWGNTTKLVIGLSLVLFCAFLFMRFMGIVGPLLLAFLLAYLFYPIAGLMRKWFGLSWRIAVTLIYIVVLILLLGSFGIGGIAVVDQVQSLINFLQGALKDLPNSINNFASQSYEFGPFRLNLSMLDFNAISQQILGAVQPILSQAGTSVVTLATKIGTVIGWMFFILLVSYFTLAESGGFPNRLINFNIPGYEEDVAQLSKELSKIWNAFLRGQITIVIITILFYNVLLGGLGIRLFFGLALLAGLARFIPYVGPLVAWTSYGLVAFFQGTTIFGLAPLGYVALVVGAAWLTDLIIDNFMVPRLMSSALRVHPAAVMVSALVAFNLLGVIGMVLAAPVLATVKLFIDYVVAKLMDQDPWAHLDVNPEPAPITPILPQLQKQVDHFREKVIKPMARREK